MYHLDTKMDQNLCNLFLSNVMVLSKFNEIRYGFITLTSKSCLKRDAIVQKLRTNPSFYV